jgi:muramidase (phage lysozyme)
LKGARTLLLSLSVVLVVASSATAVQHQRNNRKARAALTISFVKTIHWAEGTAHTENPYRTRYTHEQVPDSIPLDQHPYFSDGRIPCSGDLCSAATGASQWMPDTWAKVLEVCGNRLNPNEPEFGPENQDRATICWLYHIGALPKLLNGLAWEGDKPTVNRDNFRAAVYGSCGQWASLPCNAEDSGGAYDQGAVLESAAWQQFESQLEAVYAP